jgi:hypothetical protein
MPFPAPQTTPSDRGAEVLADEAARTAQALGRSHQLFDQTVDRADLGALRRLLPLYSSIL